MTWCAGATGSARPSSGCVCAVNHRCAGSVVGHAFAVSGSDPFTVERGAQMDERTIPDRTYGEMELARLGGGDMIKIKVRSDRGETRWINVPSPQWARIYSAITEID